MTQGEEADIAPVIKVAITTGKSENPTRIIVEDNGPGIPPEIIGGIIDYDIRVSSREAYISPTRGRQGNALKTILPMAYVLGGGIKGGTWIEARGLKHRIPFTVNQIKQEPIVKNISSRSRITNGTRVTVFWPDTYEAEIDADQIGDLLKQFVWVNPHLTLQFTVDGKSVLRHEATNPKWTKYRACDATSAHWYSPKQFERYAGALVDRDLEFRKRRPRSRRGETHRQGFHRTIPGHERDRKAETGPAGTRGGAHVPSSVLRLRSSAQSRAHEQIARPRPEAHPADAAGIARRHWRGAFAAIERRRGRRRAELQIFLLPLSSR
jgi:hypothetical protein